MSKKQARRILTGSPPEWKDMKVEAVNFSNEVKLPYNFFFTTDRNGSRYPNNFPPETSLSTAESLPFPLCKVCACEEGFM
jgi:hypothetical protein